MRLVLVGSGDFVRPVLDRLAERVCLVVTAPPRPAGRGRRARRTPVAERAAEIGLAVLETPDINDPEAVSAIARAEPETIIVADFGQIVGKAVRRLPEREIINLHPSLLPKYRGAAPVERALMAGERITGVTVIRVTGRMDAGPVLLRAETPVGELETAPELERRLARLAADLAVKALGEIARGRAVFTPQDESAATRAPKIGRDEGRIRWDREAPEVAALVRALGQRPGAWALLPGPGDAAARRLYIREGRALEKPEGEPGRGSGFAGDALVVTCGRGALAAGRVQAPGRKTVTGAEFARGKPFVNDCLLE